MILQECLEHCVLMVSQMDGQQSQLFQVQTRWHPNDPLGQGLHKFLNFFLCSVRYVDLETHSKLLQLQPLLPITIASLPTTQKPFDWAGFIRSISTKVLLLFWPCNAKEFCHCRGSTSITCINRNTSISVKCKLFEDCLTIKSRFRLTDLQV